MIKVNRTISDFFVDFDNLLLSDASGVAETVNTSEQAMVYPNPSTIGTLLKLKDVEPGKYSLKIVSASGANYLEKDVVIESKEHSAVNVSYLASGNYILDLKSTRNNYHIKFVVKD